MLEVVGLLKVPALLLCSTLSRANLLEAFVL